MEKYDVFISYSRKDYVDENKNKIPNSAVSQIMDALTRAGISFWFDENGIESGEQFAEIIEEAINDSMAFLFISSEASNSSVWTMREVFAATAKPEKLIIPVRLDDSEYNAKFRMILRPFDFVDFSIKPEKALKNIVSSINKQKERAALAKKEEQKRLEEEQRRAEEEQKKQLSLLLMKQTKEELLKLANEYDTISHEQKKKALEISEKLKKIGVDRRTCPICGHELEINSSFCPKCGFVVSPLSGIEGAEPMIDYNFNQIDTVRQLWNKVNDTSFKDEHKKKLMEKDSIIEDLVREMSVKESSLNTMSQDFKEKCSQNDKLLKENFVLKNSIVTKDSVIEDLVKEMSEKESSLSTISPILR